MAGLGSKCRISASGTVPLVVIQGDAVNRSRIATTVVCLITSNMQRAKSPGNVALKAGEANLPKDSVVNVTQLLTVDKSDMAERLGKLPAKRVAAIQRGLSLVFELG